MKNLLILWITRLRKFSTAGNERWNVELIDLMDHKVEEVFNCLEWEME